MMAGPSNPTAGEALRLTETVACAGCASKLAPGQLHAVLESMPRAPVDPALLVGSDSFDDAGVYRVSEELALVLTVDFFTPIVDDPYDYGQIAAANALSDVYAMGGAPRTALNLVCWPRDGSLEPDVLRAILTGGADKVREAGAALVGGHSVTDVELKYGLAVTGTVHPDAIVTNAGARPGDAVVLTKPLGTGILTTALKRGAIDDVDLVDAVTAMKTLSAAAMRVALAAGVHAATDVTGFGLAGHAVQLADASAVTMVVEADRLPRFAQVERLAEEGHVPGGGKSNVEHFGPRVFVAPGVDAALCTVAFDPQTSGGLLLCLPAEGVAEVVETLRAEGFDRTRHIGSVEPRGERSLCLA